MIMEDIIAFRNPKEIYNENWTFLVIECTVTFAAFLGLIHAIRNGKNHMCLYLTTILHGLAVELYSYNLKDIDNFWHYQGTIMIFKKRLPLYILLIYAHFIYVASVAVKRMNLPKFTIEPLAVGLCVVIIDIPYDILGVKFLWWTWHDTDPNIYDRMYHVPWTSYIFHASFASSFTFIYNFLSTRKLTNGNLLITSIITAIFSFPVGVIQFIIFYHPLHDIFKVHTEVCVTILLLLIYATLVWKNDIKDETTIKKPCLKFDEICIGIFLYFLTLGSLVWFVNPGSLSSTGLHEPIGDCNKNIGIMSALGQILPRNQYLCAEKHRQPFDFNCVSDIPLGKNWYTVCATAFDNRMEHCVVVSAFCVFGLIVFGEILSRKRISKIKFN